MSNIKLCEISQEITPLLSNKAGRDKLNKFLQYSTKLLSLYVMTKKADISNLSAFFGSANKANRILSFIPELKRLYELKNSKSEKVRILKVMARLAFTFYFLLDNLSILSQFHIIGEGKELNSKIGDWTLFAQFAALSLNLSVFSIENKNELLQREKGYVVGYVKKVRCDTTLKFMMMLFDVLVAGKNSGILPKMLKLELGDKSVAFMGMVSAAIGLKLLFDQSKKNKSE